jgi:hypothetical protein
MIFFDVLVRSETPTNSPYPVPFIIVANFTDT